MTTGERIKHLRERRGLTQRQLSERMGLSDDFGPVQVSHWENDRKLPSAKNLIRLCDALDCSADLVLTGDER